MPGPSPHHTRLSRLCGWLNYFEKIVTPSTVLPAVKHLKFFGLFACHQTAACDGGSGPKSSTWSPEKGAEDCISEREDSELSSECRMRMQDRVRVGSDRRQSSRGVHATHVAASCMRRIWRRHCAQVFVLQYSVLCKYGSRPKECKGVKDTWYE